MRETIKSCKGFNKDMTCTPPNTNIKFLYEEGEDYETEYASVGYCGFHGCKMPLDTFKYYQPSKSVYHEVEQSGDISQDSDDSKIASTKIKIGARIGIKGLVKAQIDFIFKKVKWDGGSEENTSGDWSSAATSGNGSSAATSGEESSAATSNPNAIALACGKNAKAKGVVGSYIVLTEWNDDADTLISVKLVQIDGKKYKPNTWYKIENGEIIECKEDD